MTSELQNYLKTKPTERRLMAWYRTDDNQRTFLLSFFASQEQVALRAITNWAHDPAMQFTLLDAARMTQQVRNLIMAVGKKPQWVLP